MVGAGLTFVAIVGDDGNDDVAAGICDWGYFLEINLSCIVFF